MSEAEKFLSPKEEQEIVEAIQIAEKNTSGEIRVHIEATANKEVYDRAIEVFDLLEMNATKDRNGVLLYVAVVDKKFVIYGDEGINHIVGQDFWDTTKDVIQQHFKKQDFKQGIVEGVLAAGEALKKHFPWQEDDENELSNEISKG